MHIKIIYADRFTTHSNNNNHQRKKEKEEGDGNDLMLLVTINMHVHVEGIISSPLYILCFLMITMLMSFIHLLWSLSQSRNRKIEDDSENFLTRLKAFLFPFMDIKNAIKPSSSLDVFSFLLLLVLLIIIIMNKIFHLLFFDDYSVEH